MQALTTLWEFDEPNDLATMSFIPVTSHTALIAPLAIIPVPLGADLKITFPDPSFATTSWCNVLPSLSGIWTNLLLAKSVALLIASVTCFA